MKNLFKSISLSLLVSYSSVVYASTGLLVSNSNGSVFSQSMGKSIMAQPGSYLSESSDVITSVGSSISLTDYHDHKWHLAGSGAMKFSGNKVELKSGYLWIQSFNHEVEFCVETANGFVRFTEGEAIVSFDAMEQKTQVLTIKGEFFLSNRIERDLEISIPEGHFSFVDQKYEDGIPRRVTAIGFQSFQKIVGLFEGVKAYIPSTLRKNSSLRVAKASPKTKLSRPARAVASVDETLTSPDLSAAAYFDQLNKVNKKSKTPVKNYIFRKKTDVIVKVYGAPFDAIKEASKRTPASVKNEIVEGQPVTVSTGRRVIYPAKMMKTKVIARDPSSVITSSHDDPFENSLKIEYKEQTRHPASVNNLINELKTFKQDYSKDY